MRHDDSRPSTGMPGLDSVLGGLLPGDNIVWQVAAVAHYKTLVTPFVETSAQQERELIYFRFGENPPLLEPDTDARIVELDPQAGFEAFLGGIHQVIESTGQGAQYLFDSLSDLSANWYCDQMVGNLFQLTCPYLYRKEAIAHFALIRNAHTQYAMRPIIETTQIMLEAYHHEDVHYVLPLKIRGQDTPGKFALYALRDGGAQRVTESHLISEIMRSSQRSGLGLSQHKLGVWARTFLKAEALLDEHRRLRASPEAVHEIFQRLLRMVISRDERVLRMAERYFDLGDLVALGKRLLGTGLIGGKSVGMLLARAILEKSNPRWETLLEEHDSFYIPSDVFYTFLVRNSCWAIRRRQVKSPISPDEVDDARARILAGAFPEHIKKRFAEMLDYFGQSPIVVRSSSLLEDDFGNSFAGKYETVFCANQGSLDKRLDQFIDAVKTVYASTMSLEALQYRARKGLLDQDEQMALLVQRVSGAMRGSLYFPQIAGVAFSYNPYVWNEDIEPGAGMIRLVFGLGTRAVDRFDEDYTRLIALNEPMLRPEGTLDDLVRCSQRRVDALNLEHNRLDTLDFTEAQTECGSIPMHLFSMRDRRIRQRTHSRGGSAEAIPIIRFDGLIQDSAFIRDMRALLKTLAEAYGEHVDVEFAANFTEEGAYRLNVVQCRPFQVQGDGIATEAPVGIPDEDVLFRVTGPVIGQGRAADIDRIVYVSPEAYGALPLRERYTVARLVGRIMHAPAPGVSEQILLMGPGRWGTTTPSLGVPVSFFEIGGASVLCEIVAMREGLVPDVSLGTHFFSELVEADMLYAALFPGRDGNFVNGPLFDALPNSLAELLPEAAAHAHVVKVFDQTTLQDGRRFRIFSDTLKQQAMCYIDRGGLSNETSEVLADNPG
jgi:pyruvate, water dikinase